MISPDFHSRNLKVVLFAVPALLLIPVLYYSLTTPFALTDDYKSWRHVQILDSSEQFLGWLYHEFLSSDPYSDPYSDLWRYWPLRVFSDAVAWKVFGVTPWLHHLSRWVVHFSSVFMFAASFLCLLKQVGGYFSVPAERGRVYHPLPLLPLGLLVYLWLFFPNSPASRLSTQEVHTVFFLGLCNWMAALMLLGEGNGRWTRSALLKYGLFCLGCLGLSLSKEVNVAVCAWMLVSYYALLLWRRGGGIAGGRFWLAYRLSQFSS